MGESYHDPGRGGLLSQPLHHLEGGEEEPYDKGASIHVHVHCMSV